MTLLVHIALWLLDSALAAAAVLALGTALVGLVRQPARRQRVGQWTLAACLLIALLAALPGRPRWSLGWIQPTTLGQPRPAGDMRGIEAFALPNGPPSPEWQLGAKALAPNHVLPSPAAASRPRLPLAPTLTIAAVGLYALLAAAALARLVGGLWTLRRLTRAALAPPLPIAELWSELATQSTTTRPLLTFNFGPFNFRRTSIPTLLLSPNLAEPISFGLLHPVVLLPARLAETGDPAALRIVLAHELVHIRRRDAWTWLLAGLVQVVFFYQPAFWLLRRELRLAQEYIADACAAQRAASVQTYAAGLLQLLDGPRRPVPVGVSAAFGRHSDFYRRMERLLQQVPTDRACSRRWTWICGGAVLLASLAVGSLTVRAREARPDPAAAVNPRVLETRGVQFLLTQQGLHGGWLEEIGPAPTALVLKSLLQAGLPLNHPAVEHGLDYLETFRQADHGFYRDSEPAYNTAIVLSVLTMLPEERHQQEVAAGREFLREVQRPAAPVSAWYRGPPALGAAERPAWADRDERAPEAVLETYGHLTYAGLKSMVYAGLTKDDQRVRQGARWLAANWTLDCNPGLGTAEGQYYYYHMLAKTLSATGTQTVTDARGATHDWRRELAAHLGQLQQADGSWVNRQSGRWLEDRPALVTAYCVLALQEGRP